MVQVHNFINLNGKIIAGAEASIPVDNGAFRYGYGLFETMLVNEGNIQLGGYHWDRLFAGLKQLYFEVPALMTGEYLETEVLRTVRRNKLEQLCRVRLQMFAAGGGMYGLESSKPGFLIECFPLEADVPQLNENGLVVGIAQGLNKSMDRLANLKSCNALIYAMGARQAKEQKWNDALICNTAGNLIESTIANLFWVKNGNIYTPPLADGCVAGIMRRHIMSTITVVEKSLDLEELEQADEVILTNAVRRMRWIRCIGACTYDNAIARKIFNSSFELL